MNLAEFSAADLERITQIAHKKEELLREVSKLEKELVEISNIGMTAASNGAHKAPSKTEASFGYEESEVTKKRLAALRSAGPQGLRTVALAEMTGEPAGRVSVWLGYRKRKHGDVWHKNGHWGMREAQAPTSAQASRTPGEGTKRAVILAALKRAGPEGLTVQALKQQTNLDTAQVRNSVYQMIRANAPVKRAGYGLYSYTESK